MIGKGNQRWNRWERGREGRFLKMGPGTDFWSHFADSGPILFLKGEMLKTINEENW